MIFERRKLPVLELSACGFNGSPKRRSDEIERRMPELRVIGDDGESPEVIHRKLNRSRHSRCDNSDQTEKRRKEYLQRFALFQQIFWAVDSQGECHREQRSVKIVFLRHPSDISRSEER